jgi:hypothetical protein
VEIDLEKPYAIIYGAGKVKYEQGGFNFDADGKEVIERDTNWAKKQKGLGGRNLLISYAREKDIELSSNEKIESVREKVIAHMT